MSLRLTKPGMRSANLAGKRHPRTGELLVPIGYLKNGSAVWPVMGGAPDDGDPDDPHFTGQEDDEDEDEDEDDEDESSKKPKTTKKSKSSKDDDEEDDEDDEEDDSRAHRASQQAKRYRLKLREAEKKNADLEARIQSIEDDSKTPDEVATRTITELREKNTTLEDNVRVMTAQLAFFKTSVPGVAWVDASDAFALAERSGLFDDAIDDDGTIDERELRRGLRDLAKRKPHLVVKLEDDKKARGRKSTETADEDEKDEDDEPGSRRSANTQNSKRKGTKTSTDRAALAKKFPVLNRM